MRSQLTRSIFARLLYNDFHFITPCYCQCTQRHQFGKRFIFGFGRRHEPSLKINAEPLSIAEPASLSTMRNLQLALKTKTRPASIEGISKAFLDFTKGKSVRSEEMQEDEVVALTETFRYIKNSQNPNIMNLQTLHYALDALARKKKGLDMQGHAALGKLVFAEIRSRMKHSDEAEGYRQSLFFQDVLAYVRLLCLALEATDARQLVVDYWYEKKVISELEAPWLDVLRSFFRQGNESEILKTTQIMEEHGTPIDSDIYQAIVCHFARKDNVAAVKQWYGRMIDAGTVPRIQTGKILLLFALRNKEFGWGDAHLEFLIDSSHHRKFAWDLVLMWAFAKGRSVDDIEQMIDVVQRKQRYLRPDVQTINLLLGLAVQQHDPYQAERVFSLGLKLGIEPDAQTCLYQIEYRLQANDADGALSAYVEYQSQDHTDVDLSTINRLVRTLCTSPKVNDDAIESVVDDLRYRRGGMEPETVAVLTTLFLRRRSLEDVEELLRIQLQSMSTRERQPVQKAIIDFILEPTMAATRAWDAYTLLFSIFKDTDRAVRTRIMQSFFNRQRSDMACHVFGHMRQSADLSIRPTAELYAQCLGGIAAASDVEGLELVHNMLKLDTEVELSTLIYNALMLGYTNCAMPYRAMEYWEEVISSIEGPSYATIEIAFRACETVTDGAVLAKTIYERLQELEVDLDKRLYVAYTCAVAAQLETDGVKALLAALPSETAETVDAWTLGSIVNATPGQNMRDELEAYFRDTYPDAFQQLEQLGCEDLSPEAAAERDEDEEAWQEGARPSIQLLGNVLDGREGTRKWNVDRSIKI